MPVENILCEPFMRNTAPCIAYANAVIAFATRRPRWWLLLRTT